MRLVGVLAVDWSGRAAGAERSIWLADARDGQIVSLESGRGRRQAVDRVIEIAHADRETVVGFDFAFSFPAWWCRQQSWSEPREVWAAMADEGERLLGACEPPLWGRPGQRRPDQAGYRKTDREGAGSAKSVFQVGGAGAVGTGSIRGMPFLLTLADAGFAVWPFDPPRWPCVVEIYPRELTGPVTKSNQTARQDYLERTFPELTPAVLKAAASSEDAFDAAVCALVMDRHIKDLAGLPQLDGPHRIEGAIWRPTHPTQTSLQPPGRSGADSLAGTPAANPATQASALPYCSLGGIGRPAAFATAHEAPWKQAV